MHCVSSLFDHQIYRYGGWWSYDLKYIFERLNQMGHMRDEVPNDKARYRIQGGPARVQEPPRVGSKESYSRQS